MKKNLVLLSILASLVMVACDDNKESYTEGSLRCNLSSSGVEFGEIWQNGSWKITETCPNSHCNDGYCQDDSLKCSNDKKPSCNGDVLEYCSDGELHYTNCALIGNGGACELGECVLSASAANALCESGESRCNINGVHQVCKSGKWENDPCDASLTCSGGSCIKPSDACNPGDKKCDGKDALVCGSNYAWQKVKTCENACHVGTCVADDYYPSAGEPCGDFSDRCVNGVYSYCHYDIMQTDGCSGDYVCMTGNDGVDNCAYGENLLSENNIPTCEHEGQIIYTSSSHSYMFYMECVAGADGKLYAIGNGGYGACDGKTLYTYDNGHINISECSEACVEHDAYSSAQCEVNGKRENVVGICNDSFTACTYGHGEIVNNDPLGTVAPCSASFDKQVAAEYGADTICVMIDKQAYVMDICNTNSSAVDCIMSADGLALTYNECFDRGDGKMFIYQTAYAICNSPAVE